MHARQEILIIGGGFGGVRCALELANRGVDAHIRLVSDRTHFEYYPALYRVVTGRSPLEVCIPLDEIFGETDVEIVEDRIVDLDLQEQTAHGSSGATYRYDTTIVALGSQTNYFGIPGLKKRSFGFGSIRQALRLRRHLHETIEKAAQTETKEDDALAGHIVVVGGGATGVELAGELAVYAKGLARQHGIDPSFIAINLVEAMPHILPAMPETVSERVEGRLRDLGVTIFTNRRVLREEVDEVILQGMAIETKTVVWAAGVTPHDLYGETDGFTMTDGGRVAVDDSLRAKGWNTVFVIGDAAATPHSGMAQTAVRHAEYAAAVIAEGADRAGPYRPEEPSHAIPVGPGWAVVQWDGLRFHGRVGWWLRRLVDLRFFLSLLPMHKAWNVFHSGRQLCESCGVCEAAIEEHVH